MATLTDQLKRGIDECDALLSDNEMFLARTKGVGAIGAEEAIDLGVTGPALRACGVPEDVRISEPYGIYDRFDFGIPVGEHGDCWDRYYVRVEEMRQSMSIVEQAMEQMEPGDFRGQDPTTHPSTEGRGLPAHRVPARRFRRLSRQRR